MNTPAKRGDVLLLGAFTLIGFLFFAVIGTSAYYRVLSRQSGNRQMETEIDSIQAQTRRRDVEGAKVVNYIYNRFDSLDYRINRNQAGIGHIDKATKDNTEEVRRARIAIEKLKQDE